MKNRYTEDQIVQIIQSYDHDLLLLNISGSSPFVSMIILEYHYVRICSILEGGEIVFEKRKAKHNIKRFT
jgi:hypothetical protein